MSTFMAHAQEELEDEDIRPTTPLPTQMLRNRGIIRRIR